MVVELLLLSDALKLLAGNPELEVLAAELLPEEVVKEFHTKQTNKQTNKQ